MKALHAVALTVCATSPYVWIVVVVALLLEHGGSPLSWSGDDWAVVAAVVLGPVAVAATLLRIPAPRRRPARTPAATGRRRC